MSFHVTQQCIIKADSNSYSSSSTENVVQATGISDATSARCTPAMAQVFDFL